MPTTTTTAASAHHLTSQEKLVVESLSTVLADTYTLQIKTQNYHWNVTGPNFYQYHKLFETQYEELSEAVDDLAERIKTLGAHAPGSLKSFAGLTHIKETEEPQSATQMIEDLKNSHEVLIQDLKVALSTAQKASDEATADLIVERLRAHDKQVWMLNSTLS